MLIVIADDITGAAEIAGIAHSRGLPTQLLMASPAVALPAMPVSPAPSPSAPSSSTPASPSLSPSAPSFLVGGHSVATPSVLVIATDTRSLSEPEAAAETRRVVAALPHSPAPFIFKKTDSALRGHVEAELHALLEATGRSHAVYMPANPSKGRIILNGIYYLQSVPLAETDFSFDPEFPARTSSLAKRFPHAAALGISMPDAVSAADVRAIAAQADADTIMAGAADLFSSLLSEGLYAQATTVERPHEHGHHATTCAATAAESGSLPPLPHPAVPSKAVLLLCGSTQSRPLQLGLPVAPMPLSVYDGSDDLAEWQREAATLYGQGHGLVLTIPHHHRTGKAVAQHLRATMARMAAALVAQQPPHELIIEGGATAFATLSQLQWHTLTVVQQVAPGVVRLQAESGSLVTLKPGSYPWGPLFATSPCH